MSSLIQKSIENFERETLTKFQPSKAFYTTVGINRIRFWQLVRGEKDITVNEAQSVANYFSIPVTSFLNQKNPKATANC